MQWVTYEEGSAVKKSVDFAASLEAQGSRVIRMNQGAEESELIGELAQFATYTGKIGPAYNAFAGGKIDEREIGAEFASAWLGLGASRKNTFMFQQNSRVPVGYAFNCASDPFHRRGYFPVTVVPRLRWPNVDGIRDANKMYRSYEYDVTRGFIDENIRGAFHSARRDGEKVAVVYTNLPNNPLGLLGTQDEIQRLQQFHRYANEVEQEIPMTHVIDNPYYGGSELKENGCFVRTPYEGISMRNTFAVISFSKALGTAKPGVSMIVVDPRQAESFESNLYNVGGVSYEPALMKNVAAILHPDNYPLLKEHFRALGAKYIRNSGYLQQAVGDRLLDGDPNMVRTVDVTKATGKRIVCEDGQTRDILDGRHVAEYIGNNYGVIVVDQSIKDWPLIRVALKTKDAEQAERGARGIGMALAELEAAPSIPGL